MKPKTKQILFVIAGFIGAVILDQWTKQMAVTNLKGKGPYIIWDGVFELLYTENRGAAFGMLQGKQWFFFLIALFVLGVVVYALIKMPTDKKFVPLTVIALFIAAGATGNLIDRIMLGYVVDFLYFSLINFPIFNVADCYVTIAMTLLVILLMVYYKEEDLACFSVSKKGENN